MPNPVIAPNACPVRCFIAVACQRIDSSPWTWPGLDGDEMTTSDGRLVGGKKQQSTLRIIIFKNVPFRRCRQHRSDDFVVDAPW